MKNLLAFFLLSLVALGPARAQSQVRQVPSFHAISVGNGIELVLTAGHGQRVEVSAPTAADRDCIQTTVESGVLVLHYKSPQGYRGMQHLRVAVVADGLTALKASGVAEVEATGKFAASQLQLDMSGGASLKADIATTTLSVHQSGGSSVTLRGSVPSLTIEASSGASFDGERLQATRCQVQASSGSSVSLAVREALVAQAGSGASVSYSGSPTLTKSTSSGGSVASR